jgi:hypothetical protein
VEPFGAIRFFTSLNRREELNTGSAKDTREVTELNFEYRTAFETE